MPHAVRTSMRNLQRYRGGVTVSSRQPGVVRVSLPECVFNANRMEDRVNQPNEDSEIEVPDRVEIPDELADNVLGMMKARNAIGMFNVYLIPAGDGQFEILAQCVAFDDYTMQAVVTLNEAFQETIKVYQPVAESPE